MHLTVPPNWPRSIGTGGRDPSERAVTIVGMRIDALDLSFKSRSTVGAAQQHLE
jgi:hypothetical protein